MVVNDYGKTAETVTLTKPNNPLDGMNKKKERPPTTYNAGNPDSGLGQTHTCCGVKPANGIPTLSSCKFNLQRQYIYKRSVRNLHRFASLIKNTAMILIKHSHLLENAKKNFFLI